MAEKQAGKEKQRFKLRKDQVQPEALLLIPEALARKYNAVPLEVNRNVLRVIMANANDVPAIQALEMVSHMRIEPETASVEDVREAIDLSYRSVKILAKMNKEAEEWGKAMIQAQITAKEKGNREAEESGKARIQAQTIAQEQANLEAEEAEKARIQAEMMAEKAKHEAEEARKQADKIGERAKQKAEEARKQSEAMAREKAKQEALAAEIAQEKAKREAEEAEKAKIQAEMAAKEKAKRETEEAEKAKIQAEMAAKEKAKRETEEAEKARIRAEMAAKEKAKREAEEAEKARIQAEMIAKEKAKREAEEAEKARIQAEMIAREKAKREAEEAEKARIQAEIMAQEKAKQEALAARIAREKAKREAEEGEKARIRAEIIAHEKARQEALAAQIAQEKARIQAEIIAHEKAKQDALAAQTAQEEAKQEAEEAEKARIRAEIIAHEKAKQEALAAKIAHEKAKQEALTAKIAQEKAKREAEEAEKARTQAGMIAQEKAKKEGTEKQRFSLRKDRVQPEALQLIPEAVARKYNIVPLEVNGTVLKVAMADSNDILVIEALETITHMSIETEAASAEEVREVIDLSYRSYDEIAKEMATISLPGEDETSIEDLTADSVAEAPIAKALTVIIDGAIKSRASDIHIQPEEDNVRVRYRIDGTLHDTLRLPLATAVPLISRLKILAKMNIADRQRPQDGQLSVKPKDRPEIDIRVATIPIMHGEMAALRLLDKSKALMALPQLGFLPEGLATYQEMLKVPYGMILCTGPTGAGKTTTLYASLNTLDRKGRNIITIEDPVEYRFKNINQIQVNPKAGLTFANGLRSILRLDPNVLLVGEMRDAETAGIAVNASLTGHLVLSTIHANDAIGVVARLIDLGIEPFLVASALIGVVAQRMGRRVCRECSKLVEAPLIEQAAYTKQTGEVRKEFLYGSGCKTCSYTGYQGRIGFYEILRISDVLRTMLLEGANASQLRERALKDGMIPLIKDGMLKVKSGITTPAEVLRNAYSAD